MHAALDLLDLRLRACEVAAAYSLRWTASKVRMDGNALAQRTLLKELLRAATHSGPGWKVLAKDLASSPFQHGQTLFFLPMLPRHHR